MSPLDRWRWSTKVPIPGGNGNDRAILQEFSMHSNSESGMAWPSRETLVTHIQCGLNTLVRCLRRLEELGLITRLKGKQGQAAVYRVNFTHGGLSEKDNLTHDGAALHPQWVKNLTHGGLQNGGIDPGIEKGKGKPPSKRVLISPAQHRLIDTLAKERGVEPLNVWTQTEATIAIEELKKLPRRCDPENPGKERKRGRDPVNIEDRRRELMKQGEMLQERDAARQRDGQVAAAVLKELMMGTDLDTIQTRHNITEDVLAQLEMAEHQVWPVQLRGGTA